MRFAPLCMIAIVLACGGDEAYTRTSETVSAPADARWQRATAIVRFEPRRSGVHASQSAEVVLSVRLEGAGASEDVVLDAYLEGGEGPGDTPRATFEQLKDPKLALAFSPDGGALGVSVDGGATHRIVSFVDEEPLYCAHATFDGDWSQAPSHRELVLEIFASADPPVGSGRLHLEPGEHPRGRFRFQRELALARAHACARLDDAELRRAVLSALVLPGTQLSGSSADEDELVACATKAVADHPADQIILVDALTGAAPDQRARAARALVDGGDARARDAIAAVLDELPPACTEADASCIGEHVVQASLAWAVAKISSRLGASSDAAREALVAASSSTHPVTRAHAVRGLAVAPDEQATARLQAIAAEPCDAPLPRWDATIAPFNRLHPEPHAAACLARAALAR